MEDETEAGPSKTKRKQAMHALQALGERVVALTGIQLAQVPLPENLHDAVMAARRITQNEGRRRQLQYVGRLMREADVEPIREALARLDGQSAAGTRALHEVEQWRERLLENDQSLTEFAATYPHCAGNDLQTIRYAIRDVRKDRLTPDRANPRRYRELFRLLRDVIHRGTEGSGQVTE